MPLGRRVGAHVDVDVAPTAVGVDRVVEVEVGQAHGDRPVVGRGRHLGGGVVETEADAAVVGPGVDHRRADAVGLDRAVVGLDTDLAVDVGECDSAVPGLHVDLEVGRHGHDEPDRAAIPPAGVTLAGDDEPITVDVDRVLRVAGVALDEHRPDGDLVAAPAADLHLAVVGGEFEAAQAVDGNRVVHDATGGVIVEAHVDAATGHRKRGEGGEHQGGQWSGGGDGHDSMVWNSPPGVDGATRRPRGGENPTTFGAASGQNGSMIGGVSKLRHAVVVASVAGTSLLAGVGVIGGGAHPERFDAKTVVVRPEGDGVRVTEYVDIDFGTETRRGYERLVPNDFGVPTEVTASSPDADDTVTVDDFGRYTRIRIGQADVTFTGQHRYELDYVLPDARFDQLGFSVDIVSPPGGIYPGDRETGRFEVVVTGFELADTTCDVGDLRVEGGCELVRTQDDPPVYRTVFEPLEEDVGLTVGGDIVAFTDPVDITTPPIPERRSEPNRGLIALGMAGLGALGSVPVYRWARRKGSNEVFAGGAADAAYGGLPAPRADGTVEPPPPVRLVPDADMDELATIEFVPPKGIEPWEAQVLLRERVDDTAVEAWFSGLAGQDAIELDEDDDELVISSGSARGELAADDRALLDRILAISDPYVTGKYDKEFASAWRRVHDAQVSHIAASGWWRHNPPGAGLSPKTSGSPFGLIVFAGFMLVWFGSAVGAFVGLLKSWPLAIAVGLLFPALVALRDVPGAAAVTQRAGVGVGAAHRIVPAVPARERGPARRVGVVEGTVA